MEKQKDNKELFKARRDRWDIYNNLPVSGISTIAKRVGCSYNTVWNVLRGRKDHYGIIKEAELIAAINIWKNRFCRFKSELTVVDIRTLVNKQKIK
jgi:hypothetical protein